MARKLARASLWSLSAAALVSAVHHVLELGPPGLVVALVFISSSYGALFWFMRSQGRSALVVFALLNVWMIVGFGLLHGIADHAVALIPLATGTATPDAALMWRHLTGIAMAGSSAWVAISGWRFLSIAADARVEAARDMRPLPLAPALVSTALLAAFVGGKAYVDSQTKTIAIMAPTSGPSAVLTQSFVRAAEMAKEDLGPEARRVRLVIVDTSGTPAQARQVVDRTFAASGIDAVLGAVSASGQFTVPYAAAKRIPHICICSVRTIGDGKYSFTNIPLPEDEATRWVMEARRRGITSVAILAQEETSVRNHANAMAREALKSGIKIVFDGRFHGDGTDFDVLALEARSANPDVVFAEAFPPLVDRLVVALRAHGVDHIASIVAPAAANGPRSFEGVWYTDTNLADDSFQQRFTSRFPGTRFAAHMTPYAYDSLKILVRAISSDDPPAYLQRITRYEGVAGVVTREPHSGNFRSKPAVWIIEDGQPRMLQP